MSLMETDKYFRYSEAAAYLDVTVEAVRQAINKGRLTVTIDHGVRWLSKEEVQAYRERTDRKGNKGKGRPPGSKDLKPRRPRVDQHMKMAHMEVEGPERPGNDPDPNN